MCDDSNTEYVYSSNGEEDQDANNSAPPRTPDYRPHEGEEKMLQSDEENNPESSPPPSQLRPTLNLQSRQRDTGKIARQRATRITARQKPTCRSEA